MNHKITVKQLTENGWKESYKRETSFEGQAYNEFAALVEDHIKNKGWQPISISWFEGTKRYAQYIIQ